MLNRDVGVLDAVGGIATRFTFSDEVTDLYPIWSPDGKRILFSSTTKSGDISNRGDVYNLYSKVVDDDGTVEVVLDNNQPLKQPFDWSEDDKFIVYGTKFPGDLWAMAFSD